MEALLFKSWRTKIFGRMSIRPCVLSCKCLKNIECFALLGLESLKCIAQNTLIIVHTFMCTKSINPSVCIQIFQMGKFRFNHVIFLFQIWCTLQCNMVTNIITIMGKRCVVMLTSISNPKFGVVNSWTLNSWQRFKTFKQTKKKCKIHTTKYPQNKFLEIFAINDLEVLLKFFSFGITMGIISCYIVPFMVVVGLHCCRK